MSMAVTWTFGRGSECVEGVQLLKNKRNRIKTCGNINIV